MAAFQLKVASEEADLGNSILCSRVFLSFLLLLVMWLIHLCLYIYCADIQAMLATEVRRDLEVQEFMRFKREVIIEKSKLQKRASTRQIENETAEDVGSAST